MNEPTLRSLNTASSDDARQRLRACCGADAWIDAMAASQPWSSAEAMHAAADQAFDQLTDDDWREAFSCHPKIGDLESLRMKFAGNRQWSHGEQQGVDAASEATLQALADGNRDYEERFGYIFIVCASGKSAEEMLELLQQRLTNEPAAELPIAAAEQRKITHLRIDKLGE